MRMYFIEHGAVTASEVTIIDDNTFTYTDSEGNTKTQSGTPFQHWFHRNSIDAIFELAQQRREFAIMCNR